jgi:hypothetical protein
VFSAWLKSLGKKELLWMLCGLRQVNKNIPYLGWLKMLQIKFSQIGLFVANVEFTHWKLSDITVKIWIVAMYVILKHFQVPVWPYLHVSFHNLGCRNLCLLIPAGNEIQYLLLIDSFFH